MPNYLNKFIMDNNEYVLGYDQELKEVNLPATGWTSTFPYTQVITDDAISVNDNPILGMVIPETYSADQIKAYQKAFGYIFAGTTADGKITFYATNKPEIDLTVGLKGR